MEALQKSLDDQILDLVLGGDNPLDGSYSQAEIYGLQHIISGTRYEMENCGVADEATAKGIAMANLAKDPDYYHRLRSLGGQVGHQRTGEQFYDRIVKAVQRLISYVSKNQPTSSSVHVNAPLGSRNYFVENEDEDNILKAAFGVSDEPAKEGGPAEEGSERRVIDPNPPISNLEATSTVDKFVPTGATGERFAGDDDVDKGAPRIIGGLGSDPNSMAGAYSLQQIISGMDWEMETGDLKDSDMAKEIALANLNDDPDFYRKKRLMADAASDPLAIQLHKDVYDGEDSPFAGVGLNLDLGSGQARKSGSIGLDVYPYDHGTIVHDVTTGLPFPDKSAERIQMVNSLHEMGMKDPKPLLSEIQRVLMPGGQFHYEGPNEIYNYPEFLELLDGEKIDKGNPTGEAGATWHKQTFKRKAIPDAATSNDSDPRIGIAQYDMLPADALLAMDALGYYWSDATASGRGNRIHGYPSQGGIAQKASGRRVATIAVKCGDYMLMGKRRDNGKWTVPGGHVDDGEEMLDGAKRELQEETGIGDAEDMESLGDIEKVADDLHVQPFTVNFEARPSTSMLKDPDGEIHRWRWINVKNGLPEEIKQNLHVPADRNILFKKIGISKSLKATPLLYLVRHGHTDRNGDENTDRIRGWDDVPLNEEGIKDAEKAADLLKESGATKVIASDLNRTRDTANIICDALHCNVQYTSKLRPWNLGNLQGQKTKDVLPEMKRLIDADGEPVPGGEPFSHFAKRFLGELQACLNDDGLPVLVTHFRNLKTAEAWIKAGCPDDFSVDKDVLKSDGDQPGSVLAIMSDGTLRNVSDVSKRYVPIFKANAAKQIVYGVVLSPNESDLQDDIMTEDDIEQAAHGYMKSRVVGSNHEKPIDAEVVESYIAPQDFDADGQYGPQKIKKGAWILGVKVHDPNEWQKVVKGEYTGFSVGGVGLRDKVDVE